MKMSRDGLVWLAAILDGEGSISKGGRDGRHPYLTIAMTDRDLVIRAATYLESNVTIKHPGSGHLGKKPLYQARANGYRAAWWMLLLYSLVGSRRRGQIRKTLRLFGETSKPRSLTPRYTQMARQQFKKLPV